MVGARVRWCCLASGLAVALAACSEEPANFSAANAGAHAGTGGQASIVAAGGRASAAELAGAGAADAAAGASAEEPPPDAGFCTGQAVSVAELASGTVRAGSTLLLPKLVASSQKFLLSVSKAGDKCWWAAFAVDEGVSGENSGVLLLSSADSVAAAADGGPPACPPAADSLPADLAPGDRIAAFGTFSDYVPSACHAVVPMRELLIKPGCAVARAGSGAPPIATVLSPEFSDRLAQGKDAALLRAWSGARVELENLDALPVDGAPGAVDPYGVVRFEQTKLELHSKIPYLDLSAGGPRQPGKALALPFPTHFERVAGVLALDYCTWSLQIRDRCLDLSPQSRGCPSSGG
jgi:hypothetical protein